MPDRNGSSGAALPFTLLLLIAFALLAAAGFLFAFLDLRTAENQASAVRAFYLAEAGLNRHLAESVDDTAGTITHRYDIDGDTVAVTSSRLLKLDPLRQLRLLRAEAAHDPLREGPSSRTVAQVALAAIPLRPPAALVSRSAVTLGSRGRISGIGAISAACAATPTVVAAVATLPGSFQGDTASLRGSPPLLEHSNIGSLLLGSGLDWRNFGRPAFVQPEIRVTSSWPASITPAPGDWPALYAESTAPPITGAVAGKGALIVAGDLVIPGSLRWEGLVLVGGTMTVSGTLDVRGAIYVDLDASRVGAASPMDLGGVVSVVYDGCAAAEAATRLSHGIVRRPGGWFEVF